MHNCNVTREQLVERALNRTQSNHDPALATELDRCPACREEFAALCSVFRVTDRAIESAQPPDSFWSGYHARLRRSLENEPVLHDSRPHTKSGARTWRGFFATSVRIPVPFAAVLLVVCGLSIAFAIHSRRTAATEPLIVTKTIEVPVTTERVVTRVVYRDRNRAIPMRVAAPGQNRAFAKQQDGEIVSGPFSLAGFKPTSDANLTIIKGSNRDEN